MIKKIAEKLKSLWGSKSKKETKVTSQPLKKEKIAAPHENTHKKEKHFESHPARKPFKKETREEYRLRHAKRDQSKQIIPSPKLEAPEEPWDESEFKVEKIDGKTRFQDLQLPQPVLHGIFDLGFSYCTDVQAETLPRSLNGDDVTAQAQTGTGKTAAFLITIYNHIIKHPVDKKRKHGMPRALILAPTRELVLQIEKDARGLGKYVHPTILALLGGIDYRKQLNSLKSSAYDILICTPGRLIDFMQKQLVDLSKIEILIIDEADRMLDMGFIPSVKKIIAATPAKAKRQTMFFSATFTTDVKRLAQSWTREAFEITVNKEDVAVQSVEQITYITTVHEKTTLLYNLIMKKNLERVLVFVNRKDDAKLLKERFETYGISTALLSGDVEQTQRIKRLEKFREGKVRVLVATDVASRGIHVEAISHVINFNLPQDVEEYVHRIGRTGRAGASGISISFADENESHEIPKLEEFLGKKIECTFPDDDLLIEIPKAHQLPEAKKNTNKPKRPYNPHRFKNKKPNPGKTPPKNG